MFARTLLSLTVCFALVTIPQPVRSDVIELNGGQKIEGDVLKETEGILFVDVGVDVVRIPLKEVRSRTKSSDATSAPLQVAKHDLYSTARLPIRNVKDLSEKFGEAVVLVQTPSGLGSGFIINQRGYCVTNYHVVERETRIAVTIYHRDGSEFSRRRIDDIEIAALNPFFDLALLKIPVQEDLKFRSVFLAGDDNHREGDDVFAIGNPLGLERSVSQGIVSMRNRNFQGLVYIQTTAQINPGNSGGPLFNLRGEVVGVTNMKLTFAEGLGFAIPVAYLKHFLNNWDAFAFDRNNPNAGYRYLEAPPRKNPAAPPRS